MSALPQHSQKAFKDFAPFLAQIVENYPKPTIFRPPNANTFVARIRDAVKGMRLNGWSSPSVNAANLSPILKSFNTGGEFIFTITDQGVYCGPPLRNNGDVEVSTGTIIRGIDKDQLDARNEQVFDAILTLKQHSLIDYPVRFINATPLQRFKVEADELVEYLEQDDQLILI